MMGAAKNALGSEMMTWLLARLAEANGDAVLLTGAGDAFSAGLNLKEVASLEPEGMTRYLQLLERCMSALYLYSGPTVALVNGHAIAGGCVLTLACDYRVATSDPRTRIGLNEVALGVRFPPRVLRIVRERVPAQSHVPVILGAELFSPERALALGLVDEIGAEPGAIARAPPGTGDPSRERVRGHERGPPWRGRDRPRLRGRGGRLAPRMCTGLDRSGRESARAEGAREIASCTESSGDELLHQGNG